MRNNNVRLIVLYGVFIALVTITTYIGLPWPFAAGGYMHLGTLTALVIAMAFGKKAGALSGGIGMFIFDIFSPWAVWALGTLVVRFAMGYVVGLIAYNNKTEKQGDNLFRNTIALVAGAVIMISGYYLYEAIFLTGFEVALASIPGNVIQFTLGAFSLIIVPVVLVINAEINNRIDE